MKINIIWGDLTDISAKKEALAGAWGGLRRTGTEVLAMSDTDAISYLNRTTVHVVGIESLRTQLSELSRPPHHHKWSRAGVRGASRQHVVR